MKRARGAALGDSPRDRCGRFRSGESVAQMRREGPRAGTIMEASCASGQAGEEVDTASSYDRC